MVLISSVKTAFKVIKNIQLTEVKKPTGRWQINNELSRNINAGLANLDCCGDKLCGDPHLAKDIIISELSKSR